MKPSDIVLWLCHKLPRCERAGGQQVIRTLGGILPSTELKLDSHQHGK